MKRLIILTLSSLALLTIAAPLSAQQNEGFGDLSTPNTPEVPDLQPVNLVQLAYQGYFEAEGIPGHSAFKSAIASGDVDAEKLIRSAIDKGRLSPDKLNDTGYINIVKTQLENLNDR